MATQPQGEWGLGTAHSLQALPRVVAWQGMVWAWAGQGISQRQPAPDLGMARGAGQRVHPNWLPP